MFEKLFAEYGFVLTKVVAEVMPRLQTDFTQLDGRRIQVEVVIEKNVLDAL
jgi:hypothetical protein